MQQNTVGRVKKALSVLTVLMFRAGNKLHHNRSAQPRLFMEALSNFQLGGGFCAPALLDCEHHQVRSMTLGIHSVPTRRIAADQVSASAGIPLGTFGPRRRHGFVPCGKEKKTIWNANDWRNGQLHFLAAHLGVVC